MATTYPLATLAATVAATGISAPAYSDILSSLQASFAIIYGEDAYYGSDSQDGQLLAIFARAIYDANQTAIAVYNSYSPATATGAALSSAVKTNGIARLVASNSQCNVTLTGVAFTAIINGQVGDTVGNAWALPPTTTIGAGGTVVVTATAVAAGAISAAIGTLTNILTPTNGWQSVTNASAASPGAPIETDAALRARQTVSVALPALTPLEATVAAVSAVAGVTEVAPYENPTDATDSNGLPAHSISIVVLGGDVGQIAAAIASKKTPGCNTYGTTTETIVDSVGVPHTINFFVPASVVISVTVTIHEFASYASTTATAIQDAVAAYINALGIGQLVAIAQLYMPAQLYGAAPLFSQFELKSVQISAYPAAVGSSDVAIAFNQIATCIAANITITAV